MFRTTGVCPEQERQTHNRDGKQSHPAGGGLFDLETAPAEINASAKIFISMADSADSNILELTNEIWKELEAASAVGAPMLIKPYFNEMIRNEDKSDFKRPMELTNDEYMSLSLKLSWNFSVKYSLYSINMDLQKPIQLCHLLIFTASKLKVFRDDAFGKVTSRCKVAAAVVNVLLLKNRILFLVTVGRQRLPARVQLINEEIFKSTIVDVVKCVADANFQCHYVGDGAGNVALAGFGLPPSALRWYSSKC